jgi:flagellar hook-associated protein 3 FlgL
MNNDVQSAQNLIIQASSGTVSTSQMSSIAAQLNELADSIKTTANTQVNGDYIFSGTATQTEPFTVGGTDTYAGNSAAVSIEVGQGVTMQTNVTGNTVVSPILAAIRQAVTDMGSGGTPGNLATTDLQAIQAAQSTLGEAQVFVGSGENRLAATTTALQAQSTATTSQLSSVQDTDIASTMINFSQETSVYQAALKAGASLIQPSLMDFLSSTS